MAGRVGRGRVLMQRLVRVGAGVIVIAVVYLAATSAQVWWVGRSAVAAVPGAAAGALVVLGAAQYDGEPSPVLAARLDHALGLWERGAAPLLVVTGGARSGDRFTEATAGADYLLARGVPDDVILREVDGESTYASLAATARFLDDRGVDHVIIVSDPYHSARAVSVAREVGLEAEVSAAPGGSASARDLLRETAALGLGQLISHRRLAAWAR